MDTGHETETPSQYAPCCLFIDNREKGIVETFGEAHRAGAVDIPLNSIFVDKLQIGDYAIGQRVGDSEEFNVRMVFERKTKADLLDSINGTRWNNQLSRMLTYLQEYSDTIGVYIIESDERDSSFYMDIADRLVDLRIQVKYTKSTYETIQYLMQRVRTLSRSDSFPQLVAKQIAQYKEFRGKKYDINSSNFLLETLKIVPKVTPECAQEIAKNYTSVADFVTRCTPNSLLGTVYKTDKNKEAHIGTIRANNIVSMFWNTDSVDRPVLQRLAEDYRTEKTKLLHSPPSPSTKHKSKRSKKQHN